MILNMISIYFIILHHLDRDIKRDMDATMLR